MTTGGLDIIGDVHGQLSALEALGRALGYDVDGGTWDHDAGRRLVFVGDLVDKGPRSLEVAQLVRAMAGSGRALCLLGNHEFNLVEWRHGRMRPKSTNRRTIEHIRAHEAAWGPVLDFFEHLPVALELDDLRVVHGAWHRGCVAALRGPLDRPAPSHAPLSGWEDIVALHSPYQDGALRPELPAADWVDPVHGKQKETALGVLMKGYEDMGSPFRVVEDGQPKTRHQRVRWWENARPEIPRDRPVAFGHHWNLPPVAGLHDAFAPPFPSGTEAHADWLRSVAAAVPATTAGIDAAEAPAICLDYSGLQIVADRQCVGAYRHPEAQVIWATAPA